MLIEFTGLFRTWEDDGLRDMGDYKRMSVAIEVQQVESVNESMFPGVCTVWTKSGRSHLIIAPRKVLVDTINTALRAEQLCYNIGNISN